MERRNLADALPRANAQWSGARLTQLRHIEGWSLLAIGFTLAYIGPLSLAILLPVMTVGFALILIPARSIREPAQQELSEQLRPIARLLVNGRSLRNSYEAAIGDSGRQKDLAGLEFEILNWIEMSELRLASHPQVAKIFEAHGGGSLIEMLDGRIRRLSEIESLLATSERLKLEL